MTWCCSDLYWLNNTAVMGEKCSLLSKTKHFSQKISCHSSIVGTLRMSIMSPPTLVGRHCFCPVCLSVTQFVSTTPRKLLNRISWNLVGSKDTICSCAYYQEIFISWILWELCPFELRNFTKFTTETACQRNSSETTEQNFMKLGR